MLAIEEKLCPIINITKPTTSVLNCKKKKIIHEARMLEIEISRINAEA
jgi:hypothetical protein